MRGKHSHTLRIDAEGNAYGDHVEYDQRNDRWLSHRWKATPDGTVSLLSPKEAEEVAHLKDANGNRYLFSSDAHKRIAKIYKVSAEGDTKLFAGGTWGDADGKGTQAQFRTFGPAVWGHDQCLYFGSGGIVRKLALDGTATTLAGWNQGFGDPDEPRASSFLGITLDKDGSVYAAHCEKREIIKITPDGKVITVLEGGLGWAPSGVTLVGNDLYVLEHRAGLMIVTEKAGFGGPRVRKVTSDGKITTVGVAR